MPSAILKADIENIPVIGPMGRSCGALYFDRAEKEEKKALMAKALERQVLAEKGIWPPLLCCSEGGTSNGKQLIEFKKGAFAGLRAVTPTVI